MIKRNVLKKELEKEKKAILELEKFYDKSPQNKEFLTSHITSLKKAIRQSGKKIINELEKEVLAKKLKTAEKVNDEKSIFKKSEQEEISLIEKETLGRLKKKEEKVIKKREKRANPYVIFSNKVFSNISEFLVKKGLFRNMKRNLIKSNIRLLAKSYISVILMSTLFSVLVGILLVGFFLFFRISVFFPFITFVQENLFERFLKVFWLVFAIPLGTFLFLLVYPLLEKKSLEININQELPFATIHMASISESLVEPSNIFKIMISAKEYPFLEKEFTKILNEVNIFGYDLVTALRNNSFNCPSKKLAELYNGIATTITSGGDLSEFFEKRAQSLLLEYRLEREKQTKSSETFMDIYISVVIAAPMILMLLLIMMRVSGLGISLSTSLISLIMVLGVSLINIVFLVFLQIKQRG